MRRPRRIVAALVLALATIPLLQFNPTASAPLPGSGVRITRIERGPRTHGALTQAGVWELTSGDDRSGGYSALVLDGSDRLTAYSDQGTWLAFGVGDGGRVGLAAMGKNWPRYPRPATDVEAAAYDPASGQTWLALEGGNAIRRVARGRELTGSRIPQRMADLPHNGGIEALARLPDGRFIAIAEKGDLPDPTVRRGFLFDTDPIDSAEPTEFLFRPPSGYDPADAVGLPDGRVIVLVRGLAFARPPFRSKLLVADSRALAPGSVWPWREIGDVESVAPRENYEGVAARMQPGGTILWLVSDANRSAFLQRNLLVRLIWTERSERGPARSRAPA